MDKDELKSLGDRLLEIAEKKKKKMRSMKDIPAHVALLEFDELEGFFHLPMTMRGPTRRSKWVQEVPARDFLECFKLYVESLSQIPERARTEQHFFTQEQLEKIIQAAPKKYQPIFCLLAGTGMRVGEACGLHVEDMDLTKRTITVKRGVYRGKEQTPKTRNAYRTVTIDQGLADLLLEHLQGRTAGRLFPSRVGTPLDANSLRNRVLKPILRKLGLQGNIHSFRHSRISILQQAGVPGDLITAWVGHSNLQITSRYTHFDESFRRDTVDRLGTIRLSLGTTSDEETEELLVPATA